MKKLIILTALFNICSVSFSQAAQAEILELSGKIEKVVDGDTVHFKPDASPSNLAPKKIKIRMLGLDTPETHLITSEGSFSQGHWGDDAANELAALLPIGTRVTLISNGLDRYGRTLGKILLGNLDVNLEMIRRGKAIPYLICDQAHCDESFVNSEDTRTYTQACEQAKTAGLGIFNPQDPLQEMPFEFRLRIQKRKADKFVGDFETKRYVSPAQYKDVELCNRLFFFKEADALAVGYQKRN